MPIVEGAPCAFSDDEYVTDAIPHEEGILWVTSGAKVTYSFEWHDYLEQPMGISWPFLEIRKTLNDDKGGSHVCSSFVPGCEVFGSFNGRSVYSKQAFLDRFDDTEVNPLTELAQVYCDSRDMLLLQYHEHSWIEPGRHVAHFDKHSGGHIRLLRASCWVFLELRMAFFNDRLSGEHIELEQPVFGEIDLDLWRNIYQARTAEEYRAWHSTHLVEPTFLAPLVFMRINVTGEPDPQVRLLTETWTPARARELVGEEILRQVKKD